MGPPPPHTSIDWADSLRSQEWKPGDWKCPICGNHNYGNRVTCNNQHCPTVMFKRGDWLCTECKGHNWANKMSCQRCRAVRV